jgi:wyosine [tRNA(Phe)-imidazoG37] synthetase (radical SAM superfamily)
LAERPNAAVLKTVVGQPTGGSNPSLSASESSAPRNMHARQLLTTLDHNRDAAGLKYVYPVISRRAGGVSIGVNLNPNNACNWACAYCQVPALRRGASPLIDLAVLEGELRGFLDYALHGDFMQCQVPPQTRHLNDIAISGNGEPTSSKQFDQVVDVIGRVMKDCGPIRHLKLVLITNGSLMQRDIVQRGLKRMARLNGEVWFKLDRATAEGILKVNHTRLSLGALRENLRSSAALCPTWLQTCVFAMDGEPPPAKERQAYLDFIAQLQADGTPVRGVLLYGLARPSMQPEASRLSPLPREWMSKFAREIEAHGLVVKLTE